MSKSHSNKIIKKWTRVAGVLLGLQLDCYLPWGHCNLYLIIVLTFVFCIFLLHIATWTSNSIKDISSLFRHDILAWYFGIEFWHGKTCQNFQLEILAWNFMPKVLGRLFHAKISSQTFGKMPKVLALNFEMLSKLERWLNKDCNDPKHSVESFFKQTRVAIAIVFCWNGQNTLLWQAWIFYSILRVLLVYEMT